MHGQTSTEYLLLVAGVIVIAIVAGYYVLSAAIHLESSLSGSSNTSSSTSPYNGCSRTASGSCGMFVGCYVFCTDCGQSSFGYLADSGHWQIATGYYASGASGASVTASGKWAGVYTGYINTSTENFSEIYSSSDHNVVILWYLDNNNAINSNPGSCSWEIIVKRNGTVVYQHKTVSYFSSSDLSVKLVPTGASSGVTYSVSSNYVLAGVKVLPYLPGTYTVIFDSNCSAAVPIESKCVRSWSIP